jgi:hypothetical protein
MNPEKTKLLQELKAEFQKLQQLQQKNKKAFSHLSSTELDAINNAKSILAKDPVTDPSTEHFTPHVHDDQHYLDKTKNASDFFSLWNGEYTYNKNLSDFLMTPEYMDYIDHELRDLFQGHKEDIKRLTQQLKGLDTKAKSQIQELKKQIKRMLEEVDLMKKNLTELATDKKAAVKDKEEEAKSLNKEGLEDSIQQHKGDIISYLENAYFYKFMTAGKDYANNCDNERKKTYLREVMERLKTQMNQEKEDAIKLNLITEGEKGQLEGYLKQMEASLRRLETSCSFGGSPFYLITDIDLNIERDHCGKILKISAKRKVTKIENPDFKAQSLDYTKILGALPENEEAVFVPNQNKQNTLPTIALDSSNFNIKSLNDYFESNPNEEEYLSDLVWESDHIPAMEYIITDNDVKTIIGEDDIVTDWEATRTIEAILAEDCVEKVTYGKLWAQRLRRDPIGPYRLDGGDDPRIKNFEDISLEKLRPLFNGKTGIKKETLTWFITIKETTENLNILFEPGIEEFKTPPGSNADLQRVVKILKASPKNRVTLQHRTGYSQDTDGIPLLIARRKTLVDYFTGLGLMKQVKIIINDSSYTTGIDVVAVIREITLNF